MALMFSDKEMNELFEDFYVLTGMKIALFDENYTELISYPKNSDTFCICMRKYEEFSKKCRASELISFANVQKTKELNIYKCHAGFIEAMAPILENGKLIGYLMFGQVTDNNNKTEFINDMEELCKKYNVSQIDMQSKIKKIKYRNNRQIQAASKILEACCGYIRMKEMIHSSKKNLQERIDEYIIKHIDEDISVERIATEFGMSRTGLYEQIKPEIVGGLATYIRRKKLNYAKELVKKCDIPISQIASEIGYDDYNYFLRSFKKEFGISPKNLMKSTNNEKL